MKLTAFTAVNTPLLATGKAAMKNVAREKDPESQTTPFIWTPWDYVLTVGVALCDRARRAGGRATKQSRYLSYLITGDVGPTSKWQESSEPVRKSIEAPRAEGKWLGRGTGKALL